MTFDDCRGNNTAPAGAALRAADGRHIAIDFHCHMSVPEAAELVSPFIDASRDPHSRYTSPASIKVNHDQAATLKPRLTSVDVKLADMDRLGIDMQVLSPAPPQYYYWTEPELGVSTAKIINDKIAETVAAHPDRFCGLATLPMQSPEHALLEMRRAVKELGMRGIEISSNVAGMELSDERFAPIFAAAEEMDIVIFLHPLGFTQGERLSTHYLNNIIGNPLESTIAISHLIFGGVLDRFPGLKLCVAHGGGYLPTYSGRMDHAYRSRPDCRGCKQEPSTYLKRLYFDTVVFDHEQLAQMVRVYGADRIVMGSDYPFDMGDPNPVNFVLSAPGLSEVERGLILNGTARQLLQLSASEVSEGS